MSTDPTWTIFGHWHNDRLVMDAAAKGEHDDVRDPEDFDYEEGLWADSEQAPTAREAFAILRKRYEDAS